MSGDTAYALGEPTARGHLRVQPEDFQVWETLGFEFQGEGEHLYCKVRKRDANTAWVAEQLAQRAGIAPALVSFAGRKDRHAVTEQWFSLHLPGRVDPSWQDWQGENFEVLEAYRHHRKLRTGGLSGNRFQITVRMSDGFDQALLEARWEQLLAQGVPNYFGPQRFGRGGNNLMAALAMFAGRRVKRQQRGLYLSAARAHVFNRVLSQRVTDGNWCQPLPGEAMILEGSQSVFVAAQIDAPLQERIRQRDVHLSGPLWGEGEPLCQGVVRELEQAVVDAWPKFRDGLVAARVAAERRALRVIPREAQLRCRADRLVLNFWLPRGSFATALLRELIQDAGGELALLLPEGLSDT